MKRWNVALIGLLMSCQVAQPTQTDQVTQELTDCVPGGNFPNATMPAISMWNGTQPPAPSSTGTFIVYNLVAGGDRLVVLAEPTTGLIPYATQVKASDLGKLLAMAAQGNATNPGGQIEVVHPVPHCTKNCTGNDLARTTLETALRVGPTYQYGRIAAGLSYPPN